MAVTFSNRGLILKLLGFVIFISVLQSAFAGRGMKIADELDDDFQYDHNLTEILVEYASAVYVNDLDSLISWNCSRCNGHTKGFRITEVIVDVQHCLQAYVGLAKDLNAVVVAFRGTQENSIQNWMEDLYFRQLDLNYPGVTGAMVHRGFYTAYHNTTLRPRVISAIMAILDEVNDLKIMVTGHSMGGAMAAFCSLDLVANYGINDVQTVTFGQPRIGNNVFAEFYTALVPKTYRMTHNHDMVPHLPPYYSLFPQRSYHHFGREVWLYKDGLNESIRICDGSGEDPSCSRSVSGNSISDHLCYLGVFLQADSWSSCSFILENTEAEATSDGFIIRVPLADQANERSWQSL